VLDKRVAEELLAAVNKSMNGLIELKTGRGAWMSSGEYE
jgi:hypothetical protein